MTPCGWEGNRTGHALYRFQWFIHLRGQRVYQGSISHSDILTMNKYLATHLGRRDWHRMSRRRRRCSQQHTRICLRPIPHCALFAVNLWQRKYVKQPLFIVVIIFNKWSKNFDLITGLSFVNIIMLTLLTVTEDNAITCRQQFPPRVTHVDRDVVLVPDDGRLRITCRAADHHRVTILLYGLQRRILNDAWITARNYSISSNND